MKIKKKKCLFICQLTDNSLKLAKYFSYNLKKELVGIEVETLPQDIDDKKLTHTLIKVFNKYEYKHNPVILSLPSQKATLRYLKVPAQTPSEIEKIVSLQASRFLPHPNEELITGYQLLFTDKDEYSNINLVIVHKELIERYIRIFQELKSQRFFITLSSYGLLNFYDYIEPQGLKPVIIIDIDSSQSELAIISHRKLFFTHCFKVNGNLPNWEALFINEISKSQDAYLKIIPHEVPVKIVLVGVPKTCLQFAQILNKQINLPIEVLHYDKLNLSDKLLKDVLNSEVSFVNLMGLGLKETIEESLNLLPQAVKEESRKVTQRKERLRLCGVILATILMLGLCINKHLDNKALYLGKLKTKLDEVANDAKLLENKERRLQVMLNSFKKRPSVLDVFYEIYHITPSQISLVNFIYEQEKQVVLRGQGLELNSIFGFVSQLKTSQVFKGFNIKIKYATKKKSHTGEIIDFEVVCIKGR